jgi:hypothetical protein
MKIQTNIKQNSVEKYAGKSQIFEKSRTRPSHFGLGRRCPAQKTEREQ